LRAVAAAPDFAPPAVLLSIFSLADVNELELTDCPVDPREVTEPPRDDFESERVEVPARD
jgi:hypothetical protein